MKKNVTYKLKKEYSGNAYVLLGADKFNIEGMTQQQMSILYKNGTDFVEIVEEISSTNTYDKKKTNKKK